MPDSAFIPALRFHALTRLYDPVVRVATRERAFKVRLVQQLQPSAGMTVLDVGCGTGTLAISIARACPGARVVGVDADRDALRIAARKAAHARVEIELREGLAQELPFDPASFDRVVSSLMFHHLNRDQKRGALREIHRVLAPGGELHVADWGRPHGPGMRAAFLAVQLFDGFATTRDSVDGILPVLITQAGFLDPTETRRLRTPLGTISLYRALRRS